MSNFKIAWENAIKIEDKNPNQFRMCYLCKYIMNHGNKWNSYNNPTNGWNIDHIDGNHSNNNSNNLVAVHYDCNVKKSNMNYTNMYRTVKGQKWK